MSSRFDVDVAVAGGGPAGATAARDLAAQGLNVALIDKRGRIKPCGGAIPPRLIRDFEIPDRLLVAKARAARAIAPSGREVDMPIDGGFVGMVDREHFDEFLRERAASFGAERVDGEVRGYEALPGGGGRVAFRDKSGADRALTARVVIGADGANSRVAKQALPKLSSRLVFAYHEIVEAPAEASWDGTRADILYRGDLSPDFYSWVFPHGPTASVGLGSAHKGFPLRETTARLREVVGLAGARTIRKEGAPIPLKPLKRWDDGRAAVLAGDAAGVVAPASGEGIYYAMFGGQVAAEAASACLSTGKAAALGLARKRFMRRHRMVFFVLGIMQSFWYSSDKRRERFVAMCADPDVQRLTWQAYMNKELVRADPGAHLRIFFKDLGHLLGLQRV